MMFAARALLDVLFASLWQGACIALAVAALLAFTGRRLNAATRYIVLQLALAAIAFIPIVTTFSNVGHRAWFRLGYGVTDSSAEAGLAHVGDLLAISSRIDVTLSDRSVLTLTAVWIAGVFVFALGIAASSLQLARLIRRSSPFAEYGGVAIFTSPDSGMPFATGFWAPSIVVPIALTARAREEFDCIVLHELAHVRRGDAYGNAWDRTMQTLFYFNPAVWWMLRANALEREIACDDWAVAQSRDLASYTRSLAAFAVWGANARSAVPSATSGFGRATLTRIHRLEDPRRNGAIGLSHHTVGGFTIVLLTIAFTLQAFGPAVAFAPGASLSNVTIASTACVDSNARYVSGPSPERMREMPKGLETRVRVQLSAAGEVMAATLSKSSGNGAFDRAVVVAAKKGTYAAQMRNCRPLGGSYIFDAMTG